MGGGMSVQHNTYIVYGARLPWDTLRDDDSAKYEAMEPYMESAFETDDVNRKRGISIISDGMNGAYHVVGRVFAKSRVYEGLDKPFTIPASNDDLLAMVRANVAETLSDLGSPDPVECGWHVFTHYR